MPGNERVAALQRARRRQARIEAATAKAVRARTALERAGRSRSLAIARHDEKVESAEAASVREAIELSKVCGSVEAAAEILGLPLREMRRLVKSGDERRPSEKRANGKAPRQFLGRGARGAERGNDDEH
jgi:hypothetical protein